MHPLPIQVIALDLDGTLLTREGLPSSLTLATLLAARAAGMRLVLASGRMASRIWPIAAHFAPPLTVIAYNGARIQEWHADGSITTSLTTVVPHDLYQEIVTFCTERRLFLNVYSGDDLHGYQPEGDYRFGEIYHQQNGAHYVAYHRDPSGLPTQEVAKLLTITSPQDRDTLYDFFQERFGQKGSVVKSNPEYLEIMDKGVTKGSALRLWMQSHGIQPSAVTAFGDAENDLDMLQSVGHGFAVANATPGLKAAYSRISSYSHDEEVIVRELQGLGLRF